MGATAPAELSIPAVSLHGPVDETMLATWIKVLADARAGSGPLVIELSTTGGDADIGRRMAADVRLFRDQTGRQAFFLGKAAVYSAGVTVMSGFRATDRWLTREAVVMIHGRKLTKGLNLDGPLRSERVKVQALMAEIEAGLRDEREGFDCLIADTDVTMPELEQAIIGDWYLTAEEAASRKLVAGLV